MRKQVDNPRFIQIDDVAVVLQLQQVFFGIVNPFNRALNVTSAMSERTSSNAGFLLKGRFIGVCSYPNVVRTLKDQWFALAVGSTALSALIWLELLAF